MTTTITVKANHGWPVDVTQIHANSLGPDQETQERVPAGIEKDFIVYDGCDLKVHEVQPGEDENVRPQMDFGAALRHVKAGRRVGRAGWNGKGMFIFLVNGSRFVVNREPLLSIMGEGAEVAYHAHVDMKTADGQVVPWLCSQTDMLADDWQVVEVPAAS